MSDVKTIKELLFDELNLIFRTTSGLVQRIQDDQWDYRPKEEMRNLKQLVQHLVLVPTQDLLILQESDEQKVYQAAEEIADETNVDKLISVMRKGLEDLREYMNGLSDRDFLEKATRPFYHDHASVQAKWLIEIVTHAMHHRAQVFTYMKQLGHDISMADLY